MCSGPEGMRQSYGCGACHNSFDILTPWTRSAGKMELGEPRTEGPQWCFAGLHTTKPLPASDQRRVFPNTV